MKTPWGESDYSSLITKDITFYSTASHGGAKVPAAKNKSIPLPLRNENGWYEEDCEIAIVLYFFYDELICDKREKEDVLETIKRWFPAQYSAYSGEDLSEQVRERAKECSWIKDLEAEVEKYRQQTEKMKKKAGV